MRFEEQYQDVLQNLESAIMRVYRDYPDLLDYDVIDGLTALIRFYKSESIHAEPNEPILPERPLAVFQQVKDVSDWRLGRKDLHLQSGQTLELEPKTRAEILQCLQRIVKSATFWNKQNGRQGYVNFIRQFF